MASLPLLLDCYRTLAQAASRLHEVPSANHAVSESLAARCSALSAQAWAEAEVLRRNLRHGGPAASCDRHAQGPLCWGRLLWSQQAPGQPLGLLCEGHWAEVHQDGYQMPRLVVVNRAPDGPGDTLRCPVCGEHRACYCDPDTLADRGRG